MNAPDFIQADRLARLETVLGPDVTLAETIEIHETINDSFMITASFRCLRPDVKAEDLIGTYADVSLKLGEGDDSRRTWNGWIKELEIGPQTTQGHCLCKVKMASGADKLKYRVNYRTWKDQTSLEVADILFAEHGLPRPVIRVNNPPKPRAYSQQINESDWDYLMRLLQEDGLFIFFVQSGGAKGSVSGKHLMHICDDKTGYETSEVPDIRFAQGSTDKNHISELKRTLKIIPGKSTASDFTHKTPAHIPLGSTPSLINLPGNATSEHFEHPIISGYGSGGAAEQINFYTVEHASKVVMQAYEADHDRSEGVSDVRSLKPGHKFKPYDLSNPKAEFAELVLFSIKHTIRSRSYEAGDDQPEYSNTFTALPATTPATPHRTIEKPRFYGVDTMIIAGPPGEEIDVDSEGRVRGYFPWDREAKKDGTDTQRIRPMQNLAGQNFGGYIAPRVGQEVVISYFNGDGDRPLILGPIPNANNVQAYTLPLNKTRSTFRTKTYKGDGFNEFTFEDATGEENYFQHAQKNMTTRVLNNNTTRVDSHDVRSVGGNQSVEVAKNQKNEIAGSVNTVVGGAGAGALGALAGVAGIAGQTAALVQQAGSLAGGGGESLGGYSASISASALGFLSGGGLAAREGVVAGSSPRADAGTALAQAGSGVGADVGGLFSLPGVMNTIVGAFKSDSVGIASVEQIGLVKVTNVGQADVRNVGKAQKVTIGQTATMDVGKTFDITAGEKFTITCGKSKFTMDKDGNVTITGVHFTFEASGPVQISGKVVDTNPRG